MIFNNTNLYYLNFVLFFSNTNLYYKLFGVDDTKNVPLSKLKATNLLAYIRNIVFSVAETDLYE